MAQPVAEGLTLTALETLLQGAYPILRARLLRRYNDPQLAEEVGWDCLTQAYELWRVDPHYFANRDLTAWCSQRAYWRALDRLRERGRFAPLAEELGEDEDVSSGALLLARDEFAAQKTLRDRQLTWDSVQQLDEPDRFLLESYYYDDQTDQEIGTHLFGDDGTEQARGLRVWRRRQKAHARLKTLLVENGIDPSDYSVACQAV